MSEFRDEVVNNLVTKVGHPRYVLDTLVVLRNAMHEKTTRMRAEDAISDKRASDQYAAGLFEMYAFVSNLASDVRQVYGISEEKGN